MIDSKLVGLGIGGTTGDRSLRSKWFAILLKFLLLRNLPILFFPGSNARRTPKNTEGGAL